MIFNIYNRDGGRGGEGVEGFEKKSQYAQLQVQTNTLSKFYGCMLYILDVHTLTKFSLETD